VLLRAGLLISDPDLELVCVLVETIRLENGRLNDQIQRLRDDKSKLKKVVKKVVRENERLREKQLVSIERSDRLVELSKTLLGADRGRWKGMGRSDEEALGSLLGDDLDAHTPTGRNGSRHGETPSPTPAAYHLHGDYHSDTGRSQGVRRSKSVKLATENRVLKRQLKALLRGTLNSHAGHR
jgi:hypothetical protein